MNEFEKFERSKARRLAFGILFDAVFALVGLMLTVVYFSKGEIGWGIFWLVMTPVSGLLDFLKHRKRLRAWGGIHGTNLS